MPYKTDIYGRPLEGTVWLAPWGQKGIEMFAGKLKRFAISFVVRDAEAISDQQVREGIRPPVVHEADTLEAALAWCRAEEAKGLKEAG